MLIKWESGIIVWSGLCVVGFGSDVVTSDCDEEGGHGDEDGETDWVVDFSLSDGFRAPLLAGGVVALSVLVVVD